MKDESRPPYSSFILLPSSLGRSFLPLEHHPDMIRRSRFEIDRGDADQLPPVVAEAVELFSAAGVHRVVFRPDVDDLVFPGLHVRPLPVELRWANRKCSTHRRYPLSARQDTAAAGSSVITPSHPAALSR